MKTIKVFPKVGLQKYQLRNSKFRTRSVNESLVIFNHPQLRMMYSGKYKISLKNLFD